MVKSSVLVLLLALAGCAGVLPPQVQVQPAASPCDVEEASYACQVKRYHDVAQ